MLSSNSSSSSSSNKWCLSMFPFKYFIHRKLPLEIKCSEAERARLRSMSIRVRHPNYAPRDPQKVQNSTDSAQSPRARSSAGHWFLTFHNKNFPHFEHHHRPATGGSLITVPSLEPSRTQCAKDVIICLGSTEYVQQLERERDRERETD